MGGEALDALGRRMCVRDKGLAPWNEEIRSENRSEVSGDTINHPRNFTGRHYARFSRGLLQRYLHSHATWGKTASVHHCWLLYRENIAA